ncbi:radical SAM family heme chaperone HemW [Jannaschia seohaensis]|uniref:Heme chaperone HemW n=1 Tax=Jannaschia seohaensis TaxID=475081 RepID=A0A2Y9A0R7_9RHOB|nr:radical SAM family heme chaperone HemW [Jannaschia seohaensis]PWJ21762.1 oxygen-independent coproporphyrinogen-3 oxidase [Jannaschia seohaensis]SSA38040.1 oxygen-independent coproporphyrinogen-3 oxidase [Jannaschia seohaensis]
MKNETETWQRSGFGIYVHWPFCAAKCPYCDFNSHVSAKVDQARFRDAYLAELRYWAERTPGRRVSSVFFGGGTPSLMDPFVTHDILAEIRGLWTMANDLEVTLEANPTSVESARFQGFMDAGVTRMSVGLQALDDLSLKRLGRLHNAAEGRRAYEIARSVCDRVSFDLIYARQDQDLADWRRELSEAMTMGPDHLSLYQLTIEEGTAFWDRAQAGGLRGLPDEDRAVALYEVTQERCEAAGLPRYEVSNHARPGQESRHNLIYWQGGDWLGIGPGAHGRVGGANGRRATVNRAMPNDWLTAVEGQGVGLLHSEILDRADIIDEYVMMGLRRRQGIDLERVKSLGGEISAGTIARLSEDGLIALEAGRLRATERGTLLLNAIVAELSVA